MKKWLENLFTNPRRRRPAQVIISEDGIVRMTVHARPVQKPEPEPRHDYTLLNLPTCQRRKWWVR